MFLINGPTNGEELCEVWGRKLGSLPETYLGMPLGASFKEKGVWNPLIDKLRGRLALWKRKYLTKGGRLVLVKSTLESIPIYMLSQCVAPGYSQRNGTNGKKFSLGNYRGKEEILLDGNAKDFAFPLKGEALVCVV